MGCYLLGGSEDEDDKVDFLAGWAEVGGVVEPRDPHVTRRDGRHTRSTIT